MSRLSPTRRSEEGLFVLRRVDLQQEAFRAALVQGDAVLRIADELVLAFLQLEILHIELPVHRAAMEDELVRRNGKQGSSQLSDAVHVEVLQILRGHDEGGFFLSYTLEGIADILYGHAGGEPDNLCRNPFARREPDSFYRTVPV